MSEIAYGSEAQTQEFVEQHGLDVTADQQRIFGVNCVVAHTVRLALLGEAGAVEQPVSADGADYAVSRLDYFLDDRVRASRVFTAIQAGRRTEVRFLRDVMAAQLIDVNGGEGVLTVGHADDEAASRLPRRRPFDSETNPVLAVRPGSFYVIEADPYPRVDGPLVVSSLYRAGQEATEITVQPGRAEIATPEGAVHIPELYQKLLAPRGNGRQ